MDTKEVLCLDDLINKFTAVSITNTYDILIANLLSEQHEKLKVLSVKDRDQISEFIGMIKIVNLFHYLLNKSNGKFKKKEMRILRNFLTARKLPNMYNKFFLYLLSVDKKTLKHLGFFINNHKKFDLFTK